jgi:hypothetical protein
VCTQALKLKLAAMAALTKMARAAVMQAVVMQTAAVQAAAVQAAVVQTAAQAAMSHRQ